MKTFQVLLITEVCSAADQKLQERPGSRVTFREEVGVEEEVVVEVRMWVGYF